MNYLGKKGQYGIVLGVLAIVVVAFIIYSLSVSSTNTSTLPTLKGIFAEGVPVNANGVPTIGGTIKVPNTLLKDFLPKSETNPAVYNVTIFIFKYIFGMHGGILQQMGVDDGKLENLSVRGMMIIIATWVIFFLVFVDMSILVMGFGSKINGFLIGLGVSIIFANFALYYNIIIWLIGIFAFLAGLSVIAALFSIIVLGVGAHFGAGWVLTALRQKQEIWAIHKGGARAAAGVGVAKKLAEAAEKG